MQRIPGPRPAAGERDAGPLPHRLPLHIQNLPPGSSSARKLQGVTSLQDLNADPLKVVV